MLKFLEHRIADRRMLGLIRKWLKAGVMEDGCRVAATKAPQGAAISPMLATSTCTSASINGRGNCVADMRRGNVIVVRYADDSHADGWHHVSPSGAAIRAHGIVSPFLTHEDLTQIKG